MSAPGRDDILGFSLAAAPPGFAADPYPWYRALRTHKPVHARAPGAWLLTCDDDVAAVYRSTAVSSEKRREFLPKFGVGTRLYEYHTTSLVFNDPALHSRVRRMLMGALSQRAIARMEPGVVALVDGLLEALAACGPCAGMNVARLVARVAIGALARRFPGLPLDGSPARDARIRFRGFRRLPVRLS